MEGTKLKQTALVYCVYVACGDTVFSPCNEFVHDYRMYDRCSIVADIGIEGILKKIASVLYSDDLHVFYLPFTDTVRKALSTHEIQFYTVLPEADCLEEWVGRMYLGKFPDTTITDTIKEWGNVVANATEYPNEKIIRLSHNESLSSIPIMICVKDQKNPDSGKRRATYPNLSQLPYMMTPIFLLFGFGLLLSIDALWDKGTIVVILILIGSPFASLLLEHLILKL